MSTLLRTLLLTVRTVSVGLGIVGIFVPVLPTTPFFLFGAACCARSSQRFYDWLPSRRYLGQYIRNYRMGKGIPRLTRILALSLLCITILYSVISVVDILAVKVILLFIAVAVSIHVLIIPTSGAT